MFNDSRFVRHYSGKLNIQNGGGAWLGSEVISIQMAVREVLSMQGADVSRVTLLGNVTGVILG